MRPSTLELMLRRTRRRLAWARSGDALFVALAFMGIAGTAVVVFGLAWTWLPLAGVAGFATMCRPMPSLLGTANWLDRRHGLDDLLASAWSIRGNDGPWATTLRATADARAAGLPPVGGLARFSARHHACVIAASVALALTGRVLVPTSGHARPGDADDSVAAEATPPAPPRQVAAESRRAGDTAESRIDFPSPTLAARPNDSAAAAPPRPDRQPADAADGAGRADVDQVTAPKVTTPAASDLAATPPGPSGSGRPAAHHDGNSDGNSDRHGNARAGGRVAAETPASPAPTSPASPSTADVTPDHPPAAHTPASPVPAAYRDLVRDYFAR